MIFDIWDDPGTAVDNDFSYHVRITPDGKAIYNPMDSMYQTSSEISEWSLPGVVFEARDIHDSRNFSAQVNFIVKSVEFTVKRVDEGSVTSDHSALFEGTGLPGSNVEASLKGEKYVASTTVDEDGTWEMVISSTDLSDGDNSIYFTQDGQTIGDDEGSEIMLYSGEPVAESLDTWVWAVIGIVALTILLGVGAFFFLEFEDFEDDDPESMMEQQKEDDPYAWAKVRAAEQAASNLTAAPAPVPAAQPQHPGWIWDAQSNQWVADPNYVPPQQ
tara:strand:- start:665 stop:1483 length:819 start_codon:yes stop_codon:yes gene_type:complete